MFREIMASEISSFLRCNRAGLIIALIGMILRDLLVPSCCLADEPTRETEDTAIHVPTPMDVVARVLVEARVNKDDVLYDLGCGDGRIIVEASKTYGCRAVGYDISERKVAQSTDNINKHGLDRLAKAELRDIFEVDLSRASVITLYLLPELNERLIPQLEKLKEGSRVVAHEFPIEGIQHDRIIRLKSEGDDVPRKIYLYTAPLKRIASSP